MLKCGASGNGHAVLGNGNDTACFYGQPQKAAACSKTKEYAAKQGAREQSPCALFG